MSASRIPVLLAFLLLAGPARAEFRPRPYVPWTDPTTGIVWRGDLRHPRSLPALPGDAPSWVRLREFRWGFRQEEAGWRAEFGRARIDLRAVTGVSLLLYPFAPRWIAGHTALLFHLEPGGLVRRGLVRGERSTPGIPSESSPPAWPDSPEGFVISLEAHLRKGQVYGFRGGATGAYGVVYSLSTWANYRQRCLEVMGGELKRWQLRLSPEESGVLARASLEIALADHSRETYWLTRNSCATAVMDMLIAGIRRIHAPRDPKRGERIVADLLAANQAVREAGLTEGSPVPEEAPPERGPLTRVGRWIGHHARKAARLGHLRDFLGLSEEAMRRRFLGGLLVNPMMSFPAKLPLVLANRGLIADHREPEEFLGPSRRKISTLTRRQALPSAP